MPNSLNQFKPSKKLQVAPKATIKKVTVAGVKQSHTFQNNLQQILIRCEKATEIKYNFNETDFDNDSKLTITSGGYLYLRDLNFTGVTIYFETDRNNVDVEILELY